MSDSLFRHDSTILSDPDARIVTPVGNLCLRFQGTEISEHVESCHRVNQGHVIVAQYPEARLELFIAPIEPSIPPNLAVDGCVMAVFRCRAEKQFAPEFSCEWDPAPADLDGGASSGQYLNAQVWESQGVTVALGTEDIEPLSYRAAAGNWLPTRLADHYTRQFDEFEDPVDYTPIGFRIPIEPLMPGEMCQVHFVVAWKKADERDRPDTWFAVDQEARRFLGEAGVA